MKFGTTAEVIKNVTNDLTEFTSGLQTSGYLGGFTNTEQGILECVELLKGAKNPAIVVLTDGTPTACGSGDPPDCRDTSACGPCLNSTANQQLGAIEAANVAYNNGIDLIPVAIRDSISREIPNVEALARCAGVSGA